MWGAQGLVMSDPWPPPPRPATPGWQPPQVPGQPPPGQYPPGQPPPTAPQTPIGGSPGSPYGGPPGPPYGPPPPPSGSSAGKWVALVAVIVAIALIGGAVVAVAVLGGDDGDEAATQDEGEVFLEPVADVGEDPFTQTVAAPLPTEGSTTTTTRNPAGSAGIRTYEGSRPGLYGGTRNNSSCNRAQLTSFLQENRDKGEAWAEVLDIEYSEVATYIDTLTPTLLRDDTRVTNHGYRNGRATVIQSVLQRGTAVLVDRYGEPVVRCACGNPLRDPVAIRRPQYTGARWTEFSVTSLTVVRQVTVIIDEYILVDWVTGQTFRRPAGTDGGADKDRNPTTTTTAPPTTAPPTTSPPTTSPPTTSPPASPPPSLGGGDVQVTLNWGTVDDLDLSVTDPNGETISYSSPSSSSGGQLDVDSNQGCSNTTSSPVENIFWPTGSAPAGNYSVSVSYFSNCGGSDPADFSVTVRVNGEVVQAVDGSLGAGQNEQVTTFSR